jgi:acetyl esterase
MPLHPDVAAFLEMIELGREMGSTQPMHALSVEQARAEFEASADLLDPDPPQWIQVSACSIPARDGAAIPARWYRAKTSAAERCPVILYFHGGGYVVGSLDSHDRVCRRLAAATGHVVLAPAYRLAPEQRFPVALNDALDATHWLLAQADAARLDTQRLVLAGDSAGATLATVLTLMAATADPQVAFTPQAQLLFYPVTDASTARPSQREFAEGYLLESATMDWFYGHYLSDPAQRQDWRVSPLLAPLSNSIAPAYVNVAEYDPLFDEGVAYAHRLQQAGVAVTLRTEHGFTHDFLRMGGLCGGYDAPYGAAAQWLAQLPAAQ